jgi:hypothetical protein
LVYLLTHPDGYSNEQIRILIKMQQLDFISMKHLEQLRKEATPPEPFYPENLTHAPSQRFLMRERIFYLYHPDKDTTLSIELLDHPRGKEVVERMLAAGNEPSWICTVLRRVDFQATPRSIELYRHYYFDTDAVNSLELRAILSMRSHVEVDATDSDARAYQAAIAAASKNDMLSMTPASPLAPFAQALNMLWLGIMPSGLELARLTTAARTAAVLRSAENSLLGRADKARDFALTGKILTELLESVGDVSGDLQRSMMSIALATDGTEVPSIQMLTEGNYTQDLMPAQEPEAEEAHVEVDLGESAPFGSPVPDPDGAPPPP